MRPIATTTGNKRATVFKRSTTDARQVQGQPQEGKASRSGYGLRRKWPFWGFPPQHSTALRYARRLIPLSQGQLSPLLISEERTPKRPRIKILQGFPDGLSLG